MFFPIPTDFFARSTVREIAELVDETPKINPHKHLVPIRTGGSRHPIFFMHELSGDVVTYHHVVNHMDKKRPVYGLNLNLSREDWGPNTTMREMALAYAAEIQMVRDTGPYYLVGLSFGGQMAFEVGSVLTERGFPVVVFMLDTYSRIESRNLSFHSSARKTISSLKKMALPQWPQMIRKKAGTLYREYIAPELSGRGEHQDTDRFARKWEQAGSLKERQEVVMASALSTHQPAWLPGKVCYFRALQQRLKRNDSYLFWKSVSRDFVLFEKDFSHAGFVYPEHAADTAAEIMAVIEADEVTGNRLSAPYQAIPPHKKAFA